MPRLLLTILMICCGVGGQALLAQRYPYLTGGFSLRVADNLFSFTPPTPTRQIERLENATSNEALGLGVDAELAFFLNRYLGLGVGLGYSRYSGDFTYNYEREDPLSGYYFAFDKGDVVGSPGNGQDTGGEGVEAVQFQTGTGIRETLTLQYLEVPVTLHLQLPIQNSGLYGDVGLRFGFFQRRRLVGSAALTFQDRITYQDVVIDLNELEEWGLGQGIPTGDDASNNFQGGDNNISFFSAGLGFYHWFKRQGLHWIQVRVGATHIRALRSITNDRRDPESTNFPPPTQDGPDYLQFTSFFEDLRPQQWGGSIGINIVLKRFTRELPPVPIEYFQDSLSRRLAGAQDEEFSDWFQPEQIRVLDENAGVAFSEDGKRRRKRRKRKQERTLREGSEFVIIDTTKVDTLGELPPKLEVEGRVFSLQLLDEQMAMTPMGLLDDKRNVFRPVRLRVTPRSRALYKMQVWRALDTKGNLQTPLNRYQANLSYQGRRIDSVSNRSTATFNGLYRGNGIEYTLRITDPEGCYIPLEQTLSEAKGSFKERQRLVLYPQNDGLAITRLPVSLADSVQPPLGPSYIETAGFTGSVAGGGRQRLDLSGLLTHEQGQNQILLAGTCQSPAPKDGTLTLEQPPGYYVYPASLPDSLRQWQTDSLTVTLADGKPTEALNIEPLPAYHLLYFDLSDRLNQPSADVYYRYVSRIFNRLADRRQSEVQDSLRVFFSQGRTPLIFTDLEDRAEMIRALRGRIASVPDLTYDLQAMLPQVDKNDIKPSRREVVLHYFISEELYRASREVLVNRFRELVEDKRQDVKVIFYVYFEAEAFGKHVSVISIAR